MRYPFIIAMAVAWLCVTYPYGFVMFIVGAIGFSYVNGRRGTVTLMRSPLN